MSRTDAAFLANAREAVSNVYDLVCAQCGAGMNDEDFEDEDAHEYDCPNRGRDRAKEQLEFLSDRLGIPVSGSEAGS